MNQVQIWKKKIIDWLTVRHVSGIVLIFALLVGLGIIASEVLAAILGIFFTLVLLGIIALAVWLIGG